MPDERVLITGASSGIGRELAKLFAADRSDLILVARSRDKLNQLAAELRQAHGVDVRVIVQDLAASSAAADVCNEIAQAGLTVDVLVNNAGFGEMDHFERIPLERHVSMLQLNVVTLTELTRRLLPGMLERRRGRILNLGSTAAFQPGPHAAVYYASKAYVLSFSEALTEELKGTGVTVTCLCPGPTKTGFGKQAHMDSTILFKHAMDVQPVAQAGYRALRKGRALVVPGWFNRYITLNSKLGPRWLTRKMVKWLQPLPD